MKISVTKINTKVGRLFNNHKVFFGGVYVGFLGMAHKDAESLSFFGEGQGFECLESLCFGSAKEFKNYMVNALN